MALEKNLVILAIFIILGTLASHATSRTLYESSIAAKHDQWMAKYGRVYLDSAEKERRLAIFKSNMEFVEKFNSEGKNTYKLGLNQFSDLSHEEFLKTRTGYVRPSESILPTNASSATESLILTDDNVPASVDWRDQGAVTPIKNQGSCGCCWAFSAAAAIEGIIKITTGQLISLSEQQLLDCTGSTTSYKNHGCSGGWMHVSFQYILDNGGISSESNYPYKALEGTCDTSRASQYAARITGFQNVPKNSESDLLKAVTMQPVSATIDASSPAFQNYHSGVFSYANCGTGWNHAVTVIGYGTTEDGIKYWLIKNQWGESWGENGYMKLLRDAGPPEGLCGIAQIASYPTA